MPPHKGAIKTGEIMSETRTGKESITYTFTIDITPVK